MKMIDVSGSSGQSDPVPFPFPDSCPLGFDGRGVVSVSVGALDEFSVIVRQAAGFTVERAGPVVGGDAEVTCNGPQQFGAEVVLVAETYRDAWSVLEDGMPADQSLTFRQATTQD